MPFFLPRRLVDFEYLKGEPDPEYEKLAEPYQNDMDFAFFAVNLGYSKSDYYDLTPREAAFIRKKWEEKTVSDSTLLRNAVLNAVSNALRKKNARFRDLWKRLSRPADKEKARDDIKAVLEIEEKEGKGWVDRVYKAAGLKRKGGK